jgi:hypothetical protein
VPRAAARTRQLASTVLKPGRGPHWHEVIAVPWPRTAVANKLTASV